MTLLIVVKAGFTIFCLLCVIYLAQISWLALRHGRLFLSAPMRLGRWIARRFVGDEIVKQRERQSQILARPLGYLALVGMLIMLFTFIVQLTELYDLLKK